MEPQTILFWLFSVAMLASAALVITRHNAINSAMFLIQVFLCTAGLFLLLEAFFLAVVQVLVYAGAVVVLFLFVIMLFQIDPGQERAFPRAAALGAAALAIALGAEFWMLFAKPMAAPAGGQAVFQGGLRDVLKPLFTHYLVPFELTALIVIVAMIGIVTLSKKDPA